MPLQFRAPLSHPNCSIFHHVLSLLIAILLFSCGVAAQDTRQAQEEATKKLIVEGLQLVADGSPAQSRAQNCGGAGGSGLHEKR